MHLVKLLPGYLSITYCTNSGKVGISPCLIAVRSDPGGFSTFRYNLIISLPYNFQKYCLEISNDPRPILSRYDEIRRIIGSRITPIYLYVFRFSGPYRSSAISNRTSPCFSSETGQSLSTGTW